MRALIRLALWVPLAVQAQMLNGAAEARRLNRYEYSATIRDLLAVSFNPAADFPADDSGYGFDNISSVLTTSPSLMEHYLAAAEKVAGAAIIPPTPPAPSVQRYAATDFPFKVDFEGDYDAGLVHTIREGKRGATMAEDFLSRHRHSKNPYDP